MPFVTKSGGLCLDDGVVHTHKDINGNTVQGNGVSVKILANIGATGLDPESKEFKLAVMRGTPRPDGTSWQSKPVPVFIIQHYDFDRKTWERFIAKFEKKLKPGTTAPSFSYEPKIFDVVDWELGVRAMPLWVLEWLDEKGVFKAALTETKVESTVKKLTEDEYKLIQKALEERRAKEAPEDLNAKKKEIEEAEARNRADAEKAKLLEEEALQREIELKSIEEERKKLEQETKKLEEARENLAALKGEAPKTEESSLDEAKEESSFSDEEEEEFNQMLQEEALT